MVACPQFSTQILSWYFDLKRQLVFGGWREVARGGAGPWTSRPRARTPPRPAPRFLYLQQAVRAAGEEHARDEGGNPHIGRHRVWM
jgi:hypothetical protein